MRALTKDQGARYARVSELITDLEAAMEKNQVARDRRRLLSYARDPDQYDAQYQEQTISQCLSRGAFFMQKGKTHIHDAVLEYRRVLFLDPGHEQARANLMRLGVEPNADRTRPPEVAPARQGEATRLVPASRVVPATAPPARVRRSKWIYGAASFLALVACGAVLWFVMDSRGSDDAAGGASSPKNSMSASTTETPLWPLADFRVPDSTREEVSAPDKKQSTPAKPSAEKKTSPHLASNLDTKIAVPPVKTPEKRTKTVVRTAPPVKNEAVVESGMLSVYFLGGIGDLWVDGKLFDRQPPIEKASIPAGVHRIECRMNGDASKKTIEVTIRPGQETVIEYELGKQPVTVDE
jgi:hypothetical protein